ncbi:MAG: amidohydrolase family protein, partial [Steroidobacteraceae bacterium]
AEPGLDAALATQPYPAPPATPAQVLIRNGTVWTMDAAGVLEHADVLMENGRIAAIGRGLQAGKDALVIDATGRYVTPGIIDAHSHSATEQLDLNEGVNSISSEVRVRDVLDPHSRQIYDQLAGGVTVAHVLHGSGNPIGGQSALVKYRWGVHEPDELLFEGAPPTIKFALGENPTHAAFRAGMPRGADLRYPATRMGVSAFIRSNFELARQYQREWQHYESLSKREQARTPPPRRDLRLEPLVEILDGRRSIHSHSYRADEILMLMRLADEVGFKVGTFQHVLEGYRVADEMAAHGAGGSTFSDWWSFKMEAFDAIPWNAAIMEERGVLVSLNSDNSDLARRLNLEAAKMLHYGGLDPRHAFAMVTVNPAKQLGIDGRVGSLAAGKDADVVVWSGDPLSVFTRAELTFVDGKLGFDRARDLAHRADVAAARARLASELRGPNARETPPPAEVAGVNPPPPKVDYRWAPRAPATPVAIVGATVHTLEGPAIGNGVVVFANGRITAVGGAGTAIPAGAERIDATGKHLWPSLIHLNTVLGLSEIDSVPGSVDVSEAGDINADADSAVAVNAASTHFPVARSGGISHALVVPSGGLVGGTTTLLRTDGWTWEEMSAVRRAALALRWPEPPPPQYQIFLGPPKTLAERKKETDERVAKLDRLLDDAEAYGRAKSAGQQRGTWQYDAQFEALQPVVRGERPLWATAREKYAIEAVVRWAARRKLRLVITDARDAYLTTELLAKHQVPVVLSNIVGEPPRPDDPYDVLYSMPAKLEKAGVLFAIGSGTRSGGSGNARHISLFAGIASAYGLDREAAYRSITLNPAKILGLESVLGSIAPGKSASLALTDGDLLEAATTVEQIWIDGTKPSMDDVQKAAWRKWSGRPARASP